MCFLKKRQKLLIIPNSVKLESIVFIGTILIQIIRFFFCKKNCHQKGYLTWKRVSILKLQYKLINRVIGVNTTFNLLFYFTVIPLCLWRKPEQLTTLIILDWNRTCNFIVNVFWFLRTLKNEVHINIAIWYWYDKCAYWTTVSVYMRYMMLEDMIIF